MNMKKIETLIKNVNAISNENYLAMLNDARLSIKDVDGTQKSDNKINTRLARMNVLVTEELKNAFKKDVEFFLNFQNPTSRSTRLNAEYTNVIYKSIAIPMLTLYAHGKKSDYSDLYYDIAFSQNKKLFERYETLQDVLKARNIEMTFGKKESVAKRVSYNDIIDVMKLIIAVLVEK